MTDFLSLNQQKITFLPLEVRADSNPRHPGDFLRAEINPGKPAWFFCAGFAFLCAGCAFFCARVMEDGKRSDAASAAENKN